MRNQIENPTPASWCSSTAPKALPSNSRSGTEAGRVGKGGRGVALLARRSLRRAHAARQPTAFRAGTAEYAPCVKEALGPPLPTLPRRGEPLGEQGDGLGVNARLVPF